MTGSLVFLVALLGAPMFAVFGGAALVAYPAGGLDAALIPSELSRLVAMPLLQALPLFALAGYVWAHSRASERLLNLSRAAVGWMPGGLPLVALALFTIFTAFTGASGVAIVALGGLVLPALKADQYGERYSLGLVTSASTLGVLFAPSLPLILFAVVANPIAEQVTIDALFRACLLPGLLGLLLLGLHGWRVGLARQAQREPFSARALWRALGEAKWELPLPLVVLGGIYSGRLAISEAAVITAAYALLVEMLIYREIRWLDLAAIIRESMMLVGGILLILGMGMATTNYLVDQEVPGRLLEMVGSRLHSPLLFLLALNLLLLGVGCLMDIFTATVIVVPLLVPVALRFGIDPVHLGVIFLTNLAIGYCTPPVGMNLFITSLRFDLPLLRVVRAVLPPIVILLVLLAVVTYVPALSLWLVR